jgi:hypothetical protein
MDEIPVMLIVRLEGSSAPKSVDRSPRESIFPSKKISDIVNGEGTRRDHARMVADDTLRVHADLLDLKRELHVLQR